MNLPRNEQAFYGRTVVCSRCLFLDQSERSDSGVGIKCSDIEIAGLASLDVTGVLVDAVSEFGNSIDTEVKDGLC